MKTGILTAVLLTFSMIVFAQKIFTKTEHVRFSADGKQVIFSSAVHEGSTTPGVGTKRISSRIGIMNTDGSNLKYVTNVLPGMADAAPVLSSDGRKVLFCRYNLEKAKADIYIVNVDGTDLKQLSSKPEDETNPEFTVDNKGVVYVRKYFVDMGKPYNGELIYVDINGGNEKLLLAKEMRVVQAVPLTIGRGGYLVACAETNDANTVLPTGSMLVMVSPDGEMSEKSKMVFPQKDNLQIEHIRVVQQGGLTIYVHGSEGGGWFAKDVNYKVAPGQMKKLPEYEGYYHDVSLSPDGKSGASGTDGVANVLFWHFTNDQFGNKRIVSGK